MQTISQACVRSSHCEDLQGENIESNGFECHFIEVSSQSSNGLAKIIYFVITSYLTTAYPIKQPRLDKDQYSTVDKFVHDLRLIAANCLQFNTDIIDSLKNEDSFRYSAVNFLETSEKLCNFFITQYELSSSSSKINIYPSLLYCWLDCIKVIDEVFQVTNPHDGLQTAWYFKEPVTYFCQGQYPPGVSTASFHYRFGLVCSLNKIPLIILFLFAHHARLHDLFPQDISRK